MQVQAARGAPAETPRRNVPSSASPVDAILAGFQYLSPTLIPAAPTLREQVIREDEASARAAARRSPTRGAEAVMQGERTLDSSSRSFRRQLARATAAQSKAEASAPNQPSAADAPRAGGEEAPAQADRATPQAPSAAAGPPTLAAPAPTASAAAASKTEIDSAADAKPAPPPSPPPAARGEATATLLTSLPAPTAVSAGAAAPFGPAPIAAAPAASSVQPVAPPASAGSPSQGSSSAVPIRTDGGDASKPPARTGPLAGKSAGAATSAEDADSAETAQNVERIVRLVHGRLTRDGGVATLRLDPPELGNLRIRMELRNDALSLRIEPESELAQQMLHRELDVLRRGLESAGVQLERVEIRPAANLSHAERHDSQSVMDDGAHGSMQESDSRGGGSGPNPGAGAETSVAESRPDDREWETRMGEERASQLNLLA